MREDLPIQSGEYQAASDTQWGLACRPGGRRVGTDYYCESANVGAWELVWYPDDPLWDSDATDSACNSPGSPAWFVKILGAPTEDPIEVRISTDQWDEDIGVSRMELYVR